MSFYNFYEFYKEENNRTTRYSDFFKLYSSSKKYRFYHDVENHIHPMMYYIESLSDISPDDKKIMHCAAAFHDLYYCPLCIDNEERSVNLFKGCCSDFDFTSEEKMKVIDLIRATKLSNYCNIEKNSLEEKFVLCDLHSLFSDDKKKLIDIEQRIQREYQFFDWDDYKEGKKEIFNSISERFPQLKSNTDFILNYIESCPLKIGIYVGSFNPFHIGHFDILKQAESIFDKVIILKAVNLEKGKSEYDFNIKDFLPYHQVEYWDGFLTDFITSKSYYKNITLIRGLRTDTDFKKEEIQLRFWQDSCHKLKAIFIPCDKKYEHISSSALKVLEKFGKNSILYTISKDSVYSDLKNNWEYNRR